MWRGSRFGLHRGRHRCRGRIIGGGFAARCRSAASMRARNSRSLFSRLAARSREDRFRGRGVHRAGSIRRRPGGLGKRLQGGRVHLARHFQARLNLEAPQRGARLFIHATVHFAVEKAARFQGTLHGKHRINRSLQAEREQDAAGEPARRSFEIMAGSFRRSAPPIRLETAYWLCPRGRTRLG